MTNQYTTKDYFPEWYKSVEISLSETLVENRLSAINEFVDEEDIKLWLDIVRLALGLKIENQDSLSQIVDKFKSYDIAFPILNNDNVIRVLAQISLCFLFENATLFSQIVSRAVISSSFFSENASEIPFTTYAQQNLSKVIVDESFDAAEIAELLSDRQLELENDEDEEETVTHADHLNLIKTANYFLQENKSLKDEINVLWWLFGQYSTLYNSYFSEVGSSKMTLAAAEELFTLSSNNSVLSANHILHKVLLLANNQKPLKPISLASVIVDTDLDIKNKLISYDNLGDLTPILLALSLSKEFGDAKLWQAAFKNRNSNFDAARTFTPQEIANQIYNEITFVEYAKEE